MGEKMTDLSARSFLGTSTTYQRRIARVSLRFLTHRDIRQILFNHVVINDVSVLVWNFTFVGTAYQGVCDTFV